MRMRKRATRKLSPSIKIEISEDIERRINEGPLRQTRGRGKATWVRNLILRALLPYGSDGVKGEDAAVPGRLE